MDNFNLDDYIKDLIKFAEKKENETVYICQSKNTWEDCLVELDNNHNAFWYNTEDNSTHAILICKITNKPILYN